MPTFQIELDDGRKLRIDADNQEAALAGLQHFQSGGAQPSQPAPSTMDYVKDVAKQAAVLPARIADNAMRFGPNMANLLAKGVTALGITDPEAEAKLANRRAAISASQGGVHNIQDYLPEAQTLPGKFTQVAGETAGSSAGLPGKVLTNLGIGAATGLASEGAGQAAEKYAPNSPGLADTARIGTALLGGGLLSTPANAVARRAASAVVPTAEQLGTSGAQKLEAVKQMGVTFHPTAVSQSLDDIATKLKDTYGPQNPALAGVVSKLESRAAASAPNAQQAPDAMMALTGVKPPVPATKAPVNIGELQDLRSELGKLGFNSQDRTTRVAAHDAQEAVDNLIGNIAKNPQNVVSGTPEQVAKAANLLESGRADWSAQRRLQTIQGRIERGELNSATNIGTNPNSGRQAIKTMLLPDLNGRTQATKRGFDLPEQSYMKDIVGGSTLGNILRYAGGNALTPGSAAYMGAIGGAGALAGGTAYATGDPLWLLAAPTAYGARRVAGAITNSRERALAEMVASRSPLARQTYQVVTPPTRLNALKTGGLLGLQTGNRLLGQ